MARQWTFEERQRQAQLIQNWKPWETSTGPVTTEGKVASSQNSLKHGLRSRNFREMEKMLRLLRQRQRLIEQSIEEIKNV